MKLEKTYSLDTMYRIAKHFIVIGAGGNGGYFIPQLARMVSVQNKIREVQRLPLHRITIIEADVVEAKNLTRQNFISSDIDKNKGEVMASRYARAFGLEIGLVAQYLDTPEMLLKIMRESNSKELPVICGMVDNNKTRKLMHDAFKQYAGAFYLDVGNEEFAGQCVLGYNHHKDRFILPREGGDSIQSFSLPSVCEVFPEVMEAQDKLPTEMSCAERSESAPQNVYTNMTASNEAVGFVNHLLTDNVNGTTPTGLRVHATIFDSRTMNKTTRFNRTSELEKYAAGK